MAKTVKSKIEYSINESISHFINLKVVKDIVSIDSLSTKQKQELSLFFNYKPYADCYDQIFKNLAYFVKFDLDDYIHRFESLRKVNKNSIEWFTLQMGEAGITVHKQKYIDNVNLRNKNPSTKSSKAALSFFRKIKHLLDDHSVRVRSMFEDKEFNNHEFRIRDQHNKWFCYDFTIKELKIIIEYHGEHCHPKNTDDNEWRHLYTNETAKEVYQKDLYKKQVAEEKGFSYFIIWHGDSMTEKLNQITKIFKNFTIVVPEVPLIRKKYFAYQVTYPNGTTEIIKKLSDLKGKYNLTEYYINLLSTKKLSEFNGVKLHRV